MLAQSPNPDELYRQRENMAIARQAADIWAARAAGGQDFEAAWKLAKACYWIGTHDEEARRRPALERGVAAGEQAVKLKPDAPEGHFWMAANMGALAESFGLGQGLKYRGRIRDELQRVLAMDPAWQQGSADRALGWWYHNRWRKTAGLADESVNRQMRGIDRWLPRIARLTDPIFGRLAGLSVLAIARSTTEATPR